MTKSNIRQGDVPETDAELEQEIEKLEKRETRKTSPKNERQNKLALITPIMEKGTDDKEAKKTDTAASQKTKKASTKTTATTAKKEVTPQYTHKDLNRNGKTLMSPRIVERVFELKNEGTKNPQISEQLNISVDSVSTVLSGPEWFRVRMIAYGRKTNPNWEYPQRVEQSTEKKGN